MPIKKTVYEATTDMFIQRCEERMAAGDMVAPWKKTWDASLGMPRNLASGATYRGSNVFFCLMQGFTSPFWLTARQAKAIGGTIKRTAEDKPEPYTPITFWWFPDPSKPEDKGRSPFARFYQVWNVEQIDGIEEKVAEATAEAGATPKNPIAEAQAIVDGWTSGPEITHGGGRACYSPSTDRVSMPVLDAFHTAEDYYRTLYHELCHATGHRKRLERDGVVNPITFASHEYSEEELISEMGATMLAGYAGIGSSEADENSAAYLTHWLKKLRAEPKLLELSGRAAQKAVDLIRGIRWGKPGDKAEE